MEESSSGRRRKEKQKKEPEEPSIFDLLLQKQSTRPTPLESYSLFVGPKGAGKSSLLALLQPAGAGKAAPTPTVALEYVFARRSRNTSTLKDVAHIWELGGGMKGDGVEELVGIPVTADRLPTATLAVVLDLSQPHNVVPVCCHWLKLLRKHVDSKIAELRRTGRSDDADALMEKGRAAFSELTKRKAAKKGTKDAEHPDRRTADPWPVPLLIVANRWDSLKDETGRLAKDRVGVKALCQVLRYLAHQAGATLVFASATDKKLQKSFRSLLSYALFHKMDKSAKPETSPDKPVYVPRGADTFDAIGEAGPVDMGAARRPLDDSIARHLVEAVAGYFGAADDGALPKERDRDGLDTEEELKREAEEFAEPTVDEAYKLKMEALRKYRERRLREEQEAEMAAVRRAKKKADDEKAKAERIAKLEKDQADRRAERKKRREEEQREALAAAEARLRDEAANPTPDATAEAKDSSSAAPGAKSERKREAKGAKGSKRSQ